MTYLQRLASKRNVMVDGGYVTDVTTEPCFAGVIASIDGYFTLQRQRPDIHMHVEASGRRYAKSLMIPRTVHDLRDKRLSYREITDLSFGMIGRTPDFMNAVLCAIASHSDALGEDAHADYAANVRSYVDRCRDQNLFVTHAAINPQLDRALELGQAGRYDGVRLMALNQDGIVVEGSKMISTLAPIADDIVVFNMPGLQENQRTHALAFVVPADTEGLSIVCRKSFLRGQHRAEDYPLSNRLDEIDASLLLQDVVVPWDRVFVCNDVGRSNRFYDATFARHHSGHQSIVRALAKSELLVGVAMRVAEDLGLHRRPHIQEQLGELTTYLEMSKALVLLSEHQSDQSPAGVATPSLSAIQACRYHFPKMHERMSQMIRSLAAGSMLSNPSYANLLGVHGNDLAAALETPHLRASERVRLLSLAWDLCGTEFASRQIAFEYTHAGDPSRIAAAHYQSYAKDALYNQVKRALDHAGPVDSP